VRPLPVEDRRHTDRRQGRLKLVVTPEPLAPASDEPPFLRPNRRVRHRRARRGWPARAVIALQIGGGLLVAAWALWAGYSRVMASERLKVTRVEVRGSRFLSEGEVRGLLGPAVGENILALDLEGLKSRLRASPWVAEAAVVRSLPDTLRVEIRERTPLALAEMDRLYLMDAEGTLIDIYGPRTSAFDLPIVRGLQGVAPEERRGRAERAGGLLRELGELGSEISEVAFDRTGDVRVVLRGPGEALLMGAPPYRRKLVDFLGLRKELAARCPAAHTFDLRFRERIYVEQCEAAPAPAEPSPPEPAVVPAAPPPALESAPPPPNSEPANEPTPRPTPGEAAAATPARGGSGGRDHSAPQLDS
jgi:cell division protein FtsQ